MRIRRTKRWTALAAVLVAITAGLLVIHTAFQFSVVREDSIVLPGAALEGTKFAGLLSDTPDPAAVFHPVWTAESQNPYRLRLTLNESLIDRGQALSAVQSFVDNDLLQYLEYDEDFTHFYPDLQTYINPVIWQFCFVNITSLNSTSQVLNLMVSVCVSAVTGGVVSYSEYWRPDWPVPEALRTKAASDRLSPSISASEAEDRAVDYLVEHNYTLLSSTRHVRTWLTTRDYVEGLGAGLVYVISLRTPFGKVFPERWFDGVTIDVDSCTGRVSAFTYILLELPRIDIDELNLITLDEAYRLEYDSRPFRGPDSHVWTGNSLLRLVHVNSSEYRQFALSWSIEFRSLFLGSWVYWEAATHDASSGKYLYTGLYYSRFISSGDFMIPFEVVATAALVAGAAKLVANRWLSGRHQSGQSVDSDSTD